MIKKENTTHDIAKILISLGKIGIQLKKLNDFPLSYLLEIINDPKMKNEIFTIDNKITKLDSKPLNQNIFIKPLHNNQKSHSRKDALQLENLISNTISKLSKEDLIKYAKHDYSHKLPRVASRNAMINEIIDVAFLQKGIDLTHRSTKLFTNISRDEAYKVLTDRHAFPNKFSYQRLGMKIGLKLDKSLSKEKMIKIILDVKYSELSRFYRSFESLRSVNDQK